MTEDFIPAGKLPAAPLLVGFSGGADSVALLDWLARTARADVAAAHLNHGIRGADADADQEFCREFCRARAIPFFTRKVDVPARAAREKRNLEAVARVARQEFFAEVCSARGFAGAVLAHHADDQAETVFMRLLRGAGWRGLCGMAPRAEIVLPGAARALVLFRPLLLTPRAALREYARARALPWREDASNADLAYTRNWLRNRFFPLLAEIFPDYRERLAELAAAARERTDAFAGAPEFRKEWGGCFLPSARVAPAVCARALEKFCPPLRRRDYAEIAAVIGGGKKAGNLRDGWRLRREADGLFAFSPDARAPWTAQTFSALPFTLETADFSLTAEAVALSGKIPAADDPAVEYLNPEALCWPLTVRPPRPGETLVPFGAPSARAVKFTAFFNAAAVPPRRRAWLPVLADADGALWLAPLRLSARAAVKDLRGRAVRVRYLPR